MHCLPSSDSKYEIYPGTDFGIIIMRIQASIACSKQETRTQYSCFFQFITEVNNLFSTRYQSLQTFQGIFPSI